jgi:hypothetical protein
MGVRVCRTDTGLFLLTGPDPGWRNEADCGFQTYTRPDGSVIVRPRGRSLHSSQTAQRTSYSRSAEPFSPIRSARGSRFPWYAPARLHAPATCPPAPQPLNCAGPKHVHFRDLDGTLTAGLNQKGIVPYGSDTLVGLYPGQRSFPFDQVRSRTPTSFSRSTRSTPAHAILVARLVPALPGLVAAGN